MMVNKFKTKYNIHKGGFNVLFGYKRFGLLVKSNFHIIMELLIVSMILAFFIYGITSC